MAVRGLWWEGRQAGAERQPEKPVWEGPASVRQSKQFSGGQAEPGATEMPRQVRTKMSLMNLAGRSD